MQSSRQTGRKDARPAPRLAAVTLVELLVAASVSALLLLGLAEIVGQTQRAYQGSEARTDVMREARAALQLLAADLESVYREVPEGQTALVLHQNFAEPSLAAGVGLGSSELAFFALQPAGKQPAVEGEEPLSDLCLLRIYTEITPDTVSGEGDPISRKLFRSFTGSNETFEELVNSPESPLLQPGPIPSQNRPADNDSIVALNVVQFQVAAFQFDENGALEPWSTEAAIAGTADDLPDCIDLTLRVVGRRTAGALREEEDWDAVSESVQNLFNANTDIEDDRELKTYTVRVNLPPSDA